MSKPRKPPMYSASEPDKEAVKRICELMLEGKALKKICEMDLMPSYSIVWQWHAFDWVKDQIARAREQGTYYRDDETEELLSKKPTSMVDVAWTKLKVEYAERKNARFNPDVFAEKRALPASATPPALPNPEAAKAEDDKMASQLKQLEEKLASMAKVSRGGPRMINVTPIKKPDIDGKAVRK